MTLDEALELARAIVAAHPYDRRERDAAKLARFIIDTLGAQMPSGYDGPRVVSDPIGDPEAPPWIEFFDGTLEPDEALGIGAALIRAALAAKGGR